MKKFTRALPFVVGLLLLTTIAVLACAPHKVEICHAREGSKPFGPKAIEVAKEAAVGGHNGHSGDIIPVFDYTEREQTGLKCPSGYREYGSETHCRKWGFFGYKYKAKVPVYGDVTHTYPGKNLGFLSAFGFTGQQILDNNCQVPYQTCDETTPWVEVNETQVTQPNGDILITTFYEKYDSRDGKHVCDRKTETRTIPYESCTEVTDWQFSERILVASRPDGTDVYSNVYLQYDAYNGELVCNRRAQIEIVPPEVCEVQTEWVLVKTTETVKPNGVTVIRYTYEKYDANNSEQLCDVMVAVERIPYSACTLEGETVQVFGDWTPWQFDNGKDRRERTVEIRDAINNELCGTYVEREAKCKDLFRMWFLRDEFGDECFLISDTHPSVERQNQLCRPCSNPDWTSVKSWSGMVNSCDEWEMDKYISLSRLPLEELLKVNDRHTGKECRLPLQTCE